MLKGLARGREGSDRERSTILSDFRRELNLAGEEYRNTANRRAWVRREDERREEDSQAHWLANVRMRVGNFVTNM